MEKQRKQLQKKAATKAAETAAAKTRNLQVIKLEIKLFSCCLDRKNGCKATTTSSTKKKTDFEIAESVNYMKSFRNPKYVERYEDVIFELETPLNTGNP